MTSLRRSAGRGPLGPGEDCIASPDGRKPGRNQLAQEPEQRIGVNTNRVPVSASGFRVLARGSYEE
jgi:hypothetical protein